jgi:hypothetical protein
MKNQTHDFKPEIFDFPLTDSQSIGGDVDGIAILKPHPEGGYDIVGITNFVQSNRKQLAILNSARLKYGDDVSLLSCSTDDGYRSFRCFVPMFKIHVDEKSRAEIEAELKERIKNKNKLSFDLWKELKQIRKAMNISRQDLIDMLGLGVRVPFIRYNENTEFDRTISDVTDAIKTFIESNRHKVQHG